jgi:hypothetical protein
VCGAGRSVEVFGGNLKVGGEAVAERDTPTPPPTPLNVACIGVPVPVCLCRCACAGVPVLVRLCVRVFLPRMV